MQQQQIERFLMEFAEFDLKHLEMYGFQMVSVDAKTYRWERLDLALVVSHEPIEGSALVVVSQRPKKRRR